MADLKAAPLRMTPVAGARDADIAIVRIRRIRRGGPDIPRLGDGVSPPAPGCCMVAGPVRIVCVTPGEWLVLGAADDIATIGAAQDGAAYLTVAIGEGRFACVLTPALARAALAAYAPIDPAEALMPGRASATLFADLTALAIAEDDGGMTLVVEAAAAGHVAQLLTLLTADA